MKAGKRLISAIILADGLAFLAFFVIAAFERRAEIVIPLFATRWELARASLSLIRWLPALQFLAVALGLGSLAGSAEDLLKASTLPAIALSALLAAAALILAPGFETTQGSIEAASGRFNAALEETRIGLESGNVEAARAAYGAADAIDRDDPRAMALKDRLLGAELKASRVAKEAPPTPQKAARDIAAADAEYRSALDYFRRKDFYNAYWHAHQATELDPGRADAARTAKEAYGEILASGGGAEDAERVAFYGRKLDAFARLRSGDAITAYRLFLAMAAESPSDADVRRYLAESLADIEKNAFFKDEADSAARANLFQNFFIVIPGEGGKKTALAAREVAFNNTAAFFFDLEYAEIDPSGTATRQLYSPYAKLESDRLLLESVEREHPGVVYRPSLAGQLGGNTAAPAATTAATGKTPGVLPHELDLGLEPLEAFRIVGGLRRPASLAVMDLYDGALAAPRYGVDDAPLVLELLRRLGLPFAVFAATILGILVGIRFRSPTPKPSTASWLALPVMAAASGLAMLIAEYGDEILAQWTQEMVPGPAALVASAGIRAVVLAVLVILVASMRETGKVAAED